MGNLKIRWMKRRLLKKKESCSELIEKLSAKGPSGIAALEKVLENRQDEYKDLRLLVISKLIMNRDPAIHAILSVALRDPDIRIRRIATKKCAAVSDSSFVKSVESLAETLKNDWDADTRKSAALALGKIKDSKAVAPLCAALKDPNESVRQAAIDALINIGGENTIEKLVAIMEALDIRGRHAAAFALQKLGWLPKTPFHRAVMAIAREDYEAAIIEGAVAGEPLVASLPKSAEALIKLGPLAIGPLIRLLEKKSKDYDEWFFKDSCLHPHKHPLLIPSEPLLYDAEKAMDVLLKIGNEEAFAAAIHAACVFYRWKPKFVDGILDKSPEIVPCLIDALNGNKEYYYIIAKLLGKIRDDRAIDPLSEGLTGESLEHAAKALENIGDKRAIIALVDALERQIYLPLDNKRESDIYVLMKALQTLGWQPALQKDAVIVAMMESDWDKVISAAQDPEKVLISWAISPVSSEKQFGALLALSRICTSQSIHAFTVRLAEDAVGAWDSKSSKLISKTLCRLLEEGASIAALDDLEALSRLYEIRYYRVIDYGDRPHHSCEPNKELSYILDLTSLRELAAEEKNRRMPSYTKVIKP